ncbi:GspE/PulE family protein [Neptuniibacter sp. 1_MG-2023]|uniref:GspE/PulE family protein n=1 Tax=Neptuniibacter sp. 1_MG-2023 TaxID=3062662 RepID=UPI0026E3ABBB|nr:GspE/PulE family protein [Neptuniibacter sp. 1_MG-2023]MDO6593550.1 GspE/PulE family protein [Neptuniibacter sp. 1_MG-2023]
MAIRGKGLLEAALNQGLITPEQQTEARLNARRFQLDEVTALCYQQRLSLSSFYHAYASEQGLLFVRSSQVRINKKQLNLVPQSLVRQWRILPIEVASNDDEAIYVVTDSPENPALEKQVQRIFKTDIKLCVTDPETFESCLRIDLEIHTPEVGFDAVESFKQLLNSAYMHRASDIHIEPQAESYLIRFRVDGRLQQYGKRFSLAEGSSLVSRIKVMSHLDIAETRMPQDGGADYVTPSNIEFEMRVATAPTKHGERVTLRLLGTDNQLLTLTQLGMSSETLRQFSRVIAQPHGIVLITGPTGSGKSTTLYAALTQLKSESTNILTAEDPVEMVVEGVSQVQMNAKVNFASALRSFLRHDPDVIMVGEIRDPETAEIALKAATTGHMVLSTLHTNSAIASVTRLKNIGLEPFMIASSLQGVVAQRLARRLCQHCKLEMEADLAELDALGIEETDQVVMLSHPQGCSLCDGTGFKGRIALFETLWVDDLLRELITQGADEQQLRKHAQYYVSLAHDGCEKVIQGLTTLDELKHLGLVHRLVEEGR